MKTGRVAVPSMPSGYAWDTPHTAMPPGTFGNPDGGTIPARPLVNFCTFGSPAHVRI